MQRPTLPGNEPLDLDELELILASLTVVMAGTAATQLLDLVVQPNRADPIPYHTSKLTGLQWLEELIHGHPERIRDSLGVHREVFLYLVDQLRSLGQKDGRDVTVDEQLAIFLYTAVTGLPQRHVAERFQRSKSTISKYVLLLLFFWCTYMISNRYFKEILAHFVSPDFYRRHVISPTVQTPPPDHLKNNPRFWPYFNFVDSALDGTHFPWRPHSDERGMSRDRKGGVTQNTLAACNWKMEFTYMRCGYEGSSSDSHMFADSRQRTLKIPRGRFFLADAGFPMCPELLIPYRATRYHLREWRDWNRGYVIELYHHCVH